jgi:MFS family permease
VFFRRLRAALEPTTRGLPRTFWWLLLGFLVTRLGTFVVPYLAIYLTSERGATPAQAGVIASLWGLGAIASGPVAGTLADRLGRRATLVAALALAGVWTVALGFVEALGALGAAVLVLGFVSELYRPPMQAAIADVVLDPAARARAFALLYWTANLGFAVGLVVAGLLARIGYRWLFLADGATTLAFAAVVAAKVPESRPDDASAHPDAAALRGLAATFGDGVLVTLLVLNLAFGAILWQAHTALPIDMVAKGLGPATYGALMSVNGVVVVLAQPFLVRVFARRDPGNVLALAAVLSGAGWGMNALARSTGGFALAIVVWTVGEIANNPTGATLVAELAPAHLRGRYQGAYGMSWALASAIGPAAGAAALGAWGSSALWAGCLAVNLLVAAGHLAAASPRRAKLRTVTR